MSEQPRHTMLKRTVRTFRRARARAIDRYLRIDTINPTSISERVTIHHDSVHYEPPDYPRIWRTIRELQLKDSDVVYDIGCGMGRVLCLFARQRVSRVIGIEISPELTDRAARNLISVRGRIAPATAIVGDAARSCYDDGTVYFMYNPFGEGTLRDVLHRIQHSIHMSPRFIRIVYMNPVFEHVVDDQEWLTKSRRLHVPGYKSDVVIWES